MSKKDIVFIVNPISGTGKQKVIEKLIPKILDYNKFNPKISYTERAGHATEISKNLAGKAEIVVATGGDGTVNEVAQGLVFSDTAMAVIPTGSGNGFARHLKIPMNIKKAMQRINRLKTKNIDTIKMNNLLCANVAGYGFDAHISHLFAKGTKRGLKSYIKIILKEFHKFKADAIEIDYGNTKEEKNCFLLSIANSTQFGNGAVIAPEALVDDGKADICIIKPFPLVAAPFIGARLYLKNINNSKYVESSQKNKFTINFERKENKIHIDGEPKIVGEKLEVEVQQKKLKVVI